jgi:hypothetical protein
MSAMHAKNGVFKWKIYVVSLSLITVLAIAMPKYARPEDSVLQGFYFRLEGRGAIFAGSEMPYAEQFPEDRTLTIGLDNSFSGRVGVGFRLNNSWDMGVLYSGLKATGKKPFVNTPALGTYNAPTSYGFFNLISPFFGLNTYYSSFNAESDFTYHVVDFEAGYNFNLGQTDVRLIGGIRYANFNHQVHSVMGWQITAYPYPFIGQISREVKNWGVGPRLGVEASMPIGNRGFRLTGSISGSALFGDRDTIDSSFSAFIGPQVAQLFSTKHDNERNIFYNTDGEVGLGYAAELGNASSVMITLGYRVEAWLGVTNTRNSATSRFPDRTYGAVNANQVFHGPFLRSTINF